MSDEPLQQNPPNRGVIQKGEMDRLREENETLRKIVKDFHWQARRYADGRCSGASHCGAVTDGAPWLFNLNTQTLLSMGLRLNPTGDETIWARQGRFGLDGGNEEAANVRDLTEERLAAGHPVARGDVIPLPIGTHLARVLEYLFADGHDGPYDIVARIVAMKMITICSRQRRRCGNLTLIDGCRVNCRCREEIMRGRWRRAVALKPLTL